MQVTIEEISPVEKKVAVAIDWPHVSAKLDEAYRELGRGVTLKGFRKGKVPRNILERMFARQVEQEVQKKLVQESFVRAAHDHAIALVAEPIVDEMALEKGAGFRYSARVEVKQPFEPKDYDGVTLEKEPPSVTEPEVDLALERKREDLAEYKKIEDRAVLGAEDVVIIDVDGEVGPHKVKREGLMVDLRAPGQRLENLPGLGAALIGAPISAKDHEVTYTVPEVPGDKPDSPSEAKDVAGQPARLKITVREAREKLMPGLDDDFAKDTGEADTLAELREKVKEKLLADRDRQNERALRNDLVKVLLERNPFQVAPALVARQTETLLHRAKLQMMMQGIDPRSGLIDEGRLKHELRPAALEEVRTMFLLEAIGTQEKVEVSEADLEKKLSDMAKDRGKSVPRLKADLQKDNQMEALKHTLREEKTLDLLMSRANITMKSGSPSPSEKQP